MFEARITEEVDESTQPPMTTTLSQPASPANKSENGDGNNAVNPPGMMRQDSPMESSEYIIDQAKESGGTVGGRNHIGERHSSDGGGAETLKQTSTKDEEEAIVMELEASLAIEKVFMQQSCKREAEVKTMNDQAEEAAKLVKEISIMRKPESLLNHDFGLESLQAEEEEDHDTQANSSAVGKLSARKLIKEEMRNLDNQQRQAYIRQTLKSQQDSYIGRMSFEQKRGTSALNGQKRKHLYNRQSLETTCKKTLQLRQKLQPQSRANSKSNNGLDPSRGPFKKSANATHHFFNQRVRASTSMTMGHFEADMAIHDEYNKRTRAGNLNFDESGRSSELYNMSRQSGGNPKRKNHATAMARRSTKVESFDTSSFKGITYPNVPMKIAEKGRKNQLSNMATSTAWNETIQPAAFHTNQSLQMTHFVEKAPRAVATAGEQRRSRPMRGPSKGQMTQDQSLDKSTIVHKSDNGASISKQQSMPLNRFNASHEVTVKPMPIYDSIRQAHVNFPKEVDPTLSIMSSNLKEKLPQKQYTREATQNSQETIIVRQIEKDLVQLREDLMQDQIDREDEKTVLNAAEQQAKMRHDFDRSSNDLRKLAGCFWRFPAVKVLMEEILSTFDGIMEKNKRSLTLFVGQVRGQFQLISDAVHQQKEYQAKIEDHLHREHEFRQKVFERENTEVLQLIKDFEFIPQIRESKKAKNLEMTNIVKDLAYIQHQLENAQLNPDTLSLYGEREVPENLGIIQDVKYEKKQRTRELQINTAKRVLHRFYTKKIRVDVETQTEMDEIAMIKMHYESTIDAMLERDVELNQKIDQLTHKTNIQQQRVEMLEKVRSDMKDQIEALDQKIEMLTNLQKALLEQIKEADRERRSLDKNYQENLTKLKNSEKLNQNRIMEISKLKDTVRQTQKEVINLQVSLNAPAQDEDDESLEESVVTVGEASPLKRPNQNQTRQVKELESQLEAKKDEITKLQDQLKKMQEQLKKIGDGSRKSSANNVEEKMKPNSRKTTSSAPKTSTKNLPQSRGNSQSRMPMIDEASRNVALNAVQSRDSLASTTTQVIKDGRCPKCSTKLKNDGIISGEDVVVRFQNMVLGRQSNIFSNVMKQVQRRVVKYETKESDVIPENEDDRFGRRESDRSNVSFRPRSTMQAKKNFNNDSSSFSASPTPMRSIQTKKLSLGGVPERTTQNVNVQTSRGLTTSVSPRQQNENGQKDAKAKRTMKENAKKKLIDLTKEMGSNMNYRFALDDKEVENRVQQVKQKISQRSHEPSAQSGTNRVNSPISQGTLHRQIGDPKQYEEMLAAERYGLISGTNSFGKQHTGPFYVSEKQTQTDYEAIDVQALFLRKIDEIVGGRMYKPVSPSGRPRLTAAQDAIQTEKITAHKSNYFVATNYTSSKIYNVANVERMRKFEPMRRKNQELRHAETSPEQPQRATDENDDKDYTYYKSLKNALDGEGTRGSKEEPLNTNEATYQDLRVTDFDEYGGLKQEQLLQMQQMGRPREGSYVSELGYVQNAKSTGLNSDALREQRIVEASESVP